MDSGWATLIIISVLCFIVWAVSIPAVRRQNGKRTSGSLTSAMGVMDEIFQPAVYEAMVVLETQNEVGLPNPSPEGKPFNNGKIIINL